MMVKHLFTIGKTPITCKIYKCYSIFLDEALITTPEEIPEELQSKLLAEYEKECQVRLSSDDKGELKCKEKGDMVLVSRSGESGSTSPGKGKALK